MTKTLCITGASSGFGEACARTFAERDDVILVLIGRREERLTALAEQLAPTPCHVFALDVRDADAVAQLINTLAEKDIHIDVLINNAGLALGTAPAHKTDWNDWETMIDTNIKGLARMTHALLPGMVERDNGHIVNMGSIAGSWPYPGGNAYCATKAFVEQFSRCLRADVVGSHVRVTNIAPGLAETEFSVVRMKGDQSKADAIYKDTQPLTAKDIADIIYWTVQLPQHVNINHLEVMPTCQAWGALQIDKDMLND